MTLTKFLLRTLFAVGILISILVPAYIIAKLFHVFVLFGIICMAGACVTCLGVIWNLVRPRD